MKAQSIYISIPITGRDEAAQRAKSERIKIILLKSGYQVVVNPFELGDILKNELKREPTYEEYMQVDLRALRDCDAIYMCRGWETSKGCIRERQQAINQGQTIIYEEE